MKRLLRHFIPRNDYDQKLPVIASPDFLIGEKQSFLLKQISNSVVKDCFVVSLLAMTGILERKYCFVVSLLAMTVNIVSLRLRSD